MNVSAVIVTRGDVDPSPVLDSLPRDWEKIVWNNGFPNLRGDLAVYGRYAAIEFCEHDAIFVVDDDVELAPGSAEAIAAAYVPGSLTANMPQRFRDVAFYADHCLVGFGAIFHRDLPDAAFKTFLDATAAPADPFESERTFNRTCDIVFTALTPRILVDLPYRDLPHAHADNRMWKQPEHVGERTRMLELVRQARDA